jgi:hypothetical protein
MAAGSMGALYAKPSLDTSPGYDKTAKCKLFIGELVRLVPVEYPLTLGSGFRGKWLHQSQVTHLFEEDRRVNRGCIPQSTASTEDNTIVEGTHNNRRLG